MATEAELRKLYDAHANALYAYLLNLTRNEADTRDIIQDIFCRLARQRGLLSRPREERAFLLRMAYNAFVDLTRRTNSRGRVEQRFAQERVSLFEEGNTSDEATLRKELQAALAELPPEQRSVVHLRLWEGLTFEEVADLMQISPNTAASRYRYGIDKLRDRLRHVYEEMRGTE
ncbi:MAG: sigma-70 family RNA polymerase sigma factor [Verrucomicrobiae bacterium]|nr:sigma-70 family RNA polymerase sigma factor [Verrucomicrobiae bacterium]